VSNHRIEIGRGRGIASTILRAATPVLAFVVGLLFGRYELATTFHNYDDEGYFLLMIKHYLGGGHLYTEVFSQYGPFYTFAQKTMFRLLQLPVTHDAGRQVTLICWLLAAVLAGYFIYKLSKNVVLASAAGLASMSLARALAFEPGHPQQIILPLLMLACCASVSDEPISLLLLGAIGAALVFTKINVGIFYFAAVALTLVCRFPVGRIRTIGTGLLLFYAVGGPVVLMHRDVRGWALKYCLVAILCGVSTFLVALLTAPPASKPLRTALYVCLGAATATIAIVIGTMWQGMSASTLLEGVVWGPSRHPGVFNVPFLISEREVISGVLISGGIAWLYRFRDRWRPYADWVDALRFVIALGVIGMLSIHPSWFLGRNLPYLVVFLPLSLLPGKDGPWQSPNYFSRLFVTGLAATQFQQPYPVAGSQLHIAAAPLLLWAFVCVYDAADGMFGLAPVVGRVIGLAMKESTVGILAILLAIVLVQREVWRQPYPFPPSSLPGATSLHLSPEMEDTYQFLARNVKENCDILFTLPGMGSLNFWSETPTPNGSNLTGWMKGFSLEKQEDILKILENDPRACVVHNAELTSFWTATAQDLDASPLAKYILGQMRVVAQRGGYEILVHPRRESPWVDAD
jgi:hypothetical protein